MKFLKNKILFLLINEKKFRINKIKYIRHLVYFKNRKKLTKY